MEAKKIIEHNWKLYEANEHLTDKLIETREKTDAFADKWLMTLTAGSFGLSFALIDILVPPPVRFGQTVADCRMVLFCAGACPGTRQVCSQFSPLYPYGCGT
jgi:hypothetical protein